ncbi:hypothetical protein CTI12_AA068630 [Artemisia annua]|uniref:Uncharacterized protein n=1 Tax=Artemisia annua TaxID=35608 RepID=A0A2U1Q6S6_ARTAN|nr:hypothetical protein CTI12_AA068630 [Artemisia annua]
MRPQVVKGSNNKTRSVLTSTNGSGAPATQSKDHKSKTSTAPIPPMFEGETPTRQSQGKNNNSTIEINNPDDLNIKCRGRPSKRVIDVNNKSDSSIPHPGTPSNVRIASSKKQILAPKTTIFVSDTPGNYQEGIKGSKYKTSAMCSSRLTSNAPSRQFQVNVAKKKSSTSDKNLFTNDTPGNQLEASRIPKKNVPGSLTIGNSTASSMSKHKYNMRVERKSIRNNMSNFTTASQGYGKQPAYMAEDDVDTLYYGSVSSGMYLRQEKDSIMNAPAFGYAPRAKQVKFEHLNPQALLDHLEPFPLFDVEEFLPI